MDNLKYQILTKYKKVLFLIQSFYYISFSRRFSIFFKSYIQTKTKLHFDKRHISKEEILFIEIIDKITKSK